MTRPKGVPTLAVDVGDVRKVRIRFRCCQCHAVATFTYTNKLLRREVVFDTSGLRCDTCYTGARDAAASEFFE